MRAFTYRATRRSDGVEIHADVIDNLHGAGVRTLGNIIRDALIAAHPMARRLTRDDIDVEISLLDER